MVRAFWYSRSAVSHSKYRVRWPPTAPVCRRNRSVNSRVPSSALQRNATLPTSSERKLTAVVVADVVGYSRLTAEDEEGTIDRLRRLRSEIVEPAIASHRGRLVKTLGDGFLIEFASAVDAVRSSLEMQDG